MISVLNHTHEANLTNKMWSNAYEEGGFRYYRCEFHGYDSKTCLVAPDDSCEQCWWIFYNKLVHLNPNEGLRQRFLDAGVQAVADAAQDEHKGLLDYQPYDRPEITITLDPADKL